MNSVPRIPPSIALLLVGIKSDIFFASAKNYIPGGEKLTTEELGARINTMSPSGRSGVLEDVVGLVSLIASPEAQ